MVVFFIVAASFTGSITSQKTLTEGSTFTGCAFVDLTASGTSGAIYSYRYSLAMYDCQFVRCSSTSGTYGGAVYAREAPFTSNGVLADACYGTYVQSLYLPFVTNGELNCTCVRNCFQGTYTMSYYSTNLKQYAYNCTDNYVPGGYAASDMGTQGTAGISKYYLCTNSGTEGPGFWFYSCAGGTIAFHYVYATNSTMGSSTYYFLIASAAITYSDSVFDTGSHPLFLTTSGSTSISFTRCAFDLAASSVSGTTIDCSFGSIGTVHLISYPEKCSYFNVNTDTFTPVHIFFEALSVVPLLSLVIS